MKKLNVLMFLSSVFIFSCSPNIVEPTQIENNTQSKVYSDSGRDSFYEFLIDNSFKLDDNNADNMISLDEYLSHRPVVDNYWEKNFASIDENKDNYLSKIEIENKKVLYLRNQLSKESLRKSYKMRFESLDLDKNNTLNKDEFFKKIDKSNETSYAITILTFNLADKNKDRVLNFSEYEDLSYAFSESFNFVIQDPTLPQLPGSLDTTK